VAQVRAEFEPDADYYLSRQLVTERVNQATRDLPPGTGAPLVSSLTGRPNEVLEIVLEAKPGSVGLMELRDLADYELRNRLLGVPGVAAVEVLGGHLRQFQVQLDPDRMAALGVSLNEVRTAVGGLAIAVGLLVDAAIILTENVYHRLSVGAGGRSRREVVFAAATEVGRPIAFATLIVIAVFGPLFAMSGIEGRMYRPLAAPTSR
jgi:Cu/Ag efflux pump CusA